VGENEQARTLSFISHQSQNPFTWRHFQSDIILLCVRCYLRYSLSYRDLEEMMRERGLHIDHFTSYRCVQRYAFATQPGNKTSPLRDRSLGDEVEETSVMMTENSTLPMTMLIALS